MFQELEVSCITNLIIMFTRLFIAKWVKQSAR